MLSRHTSRSLQIDNSNVRRVNINRVISFGLPKKKAAVAATAKFNKIYQRNSREISGRYQVKARNKLDKKRRFQPAEVQNL